MPAIKWHLSLIASFPILVLPIGIWTILSLSIKPRAVAAWVKQGDNQTDAIRSEKILTVST